MKEKRLLLGTSASTQTTGMPASIALLIAGIILILFIHDSKGEHYFCELGNILVYLIL
jgi:hypothetical protein